MASFEDIEYDSNYSLASRQFFLLYDTTIPSQCAGPSSVIVLNNASILKFICPYNNLLCCRNYIHDHNQKMFTIALSDDKMNEWNDDNNQITETNIRKVFIFCETFSQYLAMKRWRGCYRRKIRGIYLSDTFEQKLLQLGVDYIREILPEFRRERGTYRRLCTDAQNLLQALNNYFQDQIDSLSDDGTEETS